jgi:hypothetical protein
MHAHSMTRSLRAIQNDGAMQNLKVVYEGGGLVDGGNAATRDNSVDGDGTSDTTVT